MNIRLKTVRQLSADCEVIVVPVFSGESPFPAGPFPSGPFPNGPWSKAWEGLTTAATRAHWPEGSERRVTVVQRRKGAAHLVVIGAGRRAGFDVRRITEVAQRAWREAAALGGRSVGLLLPRDAPSAEDDAALTEGGLQAAVLGLERGAYQFSRYKLSAGSAGRSKERAGPATAAIGVAGGTPSAWRRSLDAALEIAGGVAFARDLGNTPPNIATPAWLAREARKMAKAVGARATVLGPQELAKKGMGGILAVGAGSANGPRLVRLSIGKGPRVALIGKGVTFDTGGISIKPSAAMEEMKYDKCGACAVLGAFQAVAGLNLPFRVDAYVAFAENMPDGRAYRPGDIVRCYGRGKTARTVEIINTDAEGRMLLADTLTWASETKPVAMIDYATLTGACVVALGEGAAGLWCRDEKMANHLLTAAAASGERLWRMPLWPEFNHQMKSDHADLKNSGGRWGGANTAAAFLSNFTADHPCWAHIDLAGPAYDTSPSSGETPGATGYGVATTVNWLRRGNLSSHDA